MCSPRVRAHAALLALSLLPAACGNLPRPFQGRPGATAMRLAQPPPARLAVPPPTNALLPDAASNAYARDLVLALQGKEVPAVEGRARRGDWRLEVKAELRGEKVVPNFEVFDAAGKSQGLTEGSAVDGAQWSVGEAAAMQRSAGSAAPAIASLLTSIEAARQQSDPNSLRNRPARVLVRDVTGAPGDGNLQLARQLRLQLPQLGQIVQDNPDSADFIVQGEVRTAVEPGGGGERIEIEWIVSDVRRGEVGRVVQLNDIERGSLDVAWGEVATLVAREAAGGVRDVILKQTGARASTANQGGGG